MGINMKIMEKTNLVVIGSDKINQARSLLSKLGLDDGKDYTIQYRAGLDGKVVIVQRNKFDGNWDKAKAFMYEDKATYGDVVFNYSDKKKEEKEPKEAKPIKIKRKAKSEE